MLREWELDGKVQAKLRCATKWGRLGMARILVTTHRGVAAFEHHIAQHHSGAVPYETMSMLYDNPDDLQVLHDPGLRSLCRSMLVEVRLR